MKTRIWLTTLTAVSLAFLSGAAQAQTRVVTVPSAAGTNWVGAWSNIPLVINDATCTSALLNASAPGALQQATEVRAPANQATSILVLGSSLSICGFPFTPISVGQWSLKLVGSSQADTLANLGINGVLIEGHSGNDLLYNLGGLRIQGGPGDDRIKGSGPGLFVQGDDGNDTVCTVPPGTIRVAVGGNHHDRLTGMVQFVGDEFEEFLTICPF